MAEDYKLKNGNILKDGHTMFLEDVVTDLKRKSALEDSIKRLKNLHMAFESYTDYESINNEILGILKNS